MREYGICCIVIVVFNEGVFWFYVVNFIVFGGKKVSYWFVIDIGNILCVCL